ncbi:hypothetical protein ACFXC8_03645 [Streptomyces sp. NPDC059441]|uniref:hypothetical protein n=1 Tax=Streptomyces sp. NPDC059441 TaxID=3346829 RepID=UPI003673E9E8
MHGTVQLIRDPGRPRCAVQYTAADGDTVVVLAWHTGRLNGTGLPVRWTAEHDAVARHRATASQSLGESAALR